ncbi:MAG TPA: hypothetical protein DCO77_02890 [Nitrospiraceae bacterium]|nr:hypothetical protein [Nitrospiraceae bacterium]
MCTKMHPCACHTKSFTPLFWIISNVGTVSRLQAMTTAQINLLRIKFLPKRQKNPEAGKALDRINKINMILKNYLWDFIQYIPSKKDLVPA